MEGGVNMMKEEEIVLLNGKRKRITVMRKARKMKMLLIIIMLTIAIEIRLITAMLVLMKMIVCKTVVVSCRDDHDDKHD